MLLPGDTLVADPAIQTTEAVDIDGPPCAVWPWLLQTISHPPGFAGWHGLKTLAGLRHHVADTTQPQWQEPAVGDVIRITAENWMGLPGGVTVLVDDVKPESYIVLRVIRQDQRFDAVWSFHLEPHWQGRVRLLSRVRIALRHPGEVFAMELARPAVALGTRGLLLEIKHRVERPACGNPDTHTDIDAPGS
jgi:hypothetical protein